MQRETPFSPAAKSVQEATGESETFEFVPDQSPKIEEFEQKIEMDEETDDIKIEMKSPPEESKYEENK